MKTTTPTSLTALEDIKSLLKTAQVNHVAIIMDGNRRWAQQRHLPKVAGHVQGVQALKNLVRYAGDIGLPVMTVYAFSTENWQRGEEEVGALMKLFMEALSAELQELHRYGVQLKFIGNLTPFPPALRSLLEEAMALTAHNPGLCLQVAVNYGSRAELTRATQQLAQQVQQGLLTPQEITEDHLSQALYTQGVPDPDLLIRTGGDSRLSNYLLWQCAYTEFYVTETLWPDFSETQLNQALCSFVERERRYGR